MVRIWPFSLNTEFISDWPPYSLSHVSAEVIYVDVPNKGAYNTTLGDYRFEVLTLASIVDTMSESVCPSLLASDTFCDVLMGKMTPLMFPYLFPELDHAIFVDRYKSNYPMESACSNGNNFAGPCYSKTTSANCGMC